MTIKPNFPPAYQVVWGLKQTLRKGDWAPPSRGQVKSVVKLVDTMVYRLAEKQALLNTWRKTLGALSEECQQDNPDLEKIRELVAQDLFVSLDRDPEIDEAVID